ncbi:hypothetical protein [Thermosyntropha sp.]|uniref:hypothetical protein n=1 Tax=Thermosyntropha sp. TaxID=2740820 RepID=UPI0025F343C0|nr:hypothetical protein [Thermosyntropha sp.]MBO8158906.1 hypothetical protein [Thermosyntropha sp.]
MMLNLIDLIPEEKVKDEEDLIEKCHEIIKQIYPDLLIRWAKIYGNRWSFIRGDQTGLSLAMEKHQLTKSVGILLDNPEILTPEQKEELLNGLKEAFLNAKYV